MQPLNLISIFCLTTVINTANAQWVKVNSIPSQEIVALAQMKDTIYAAGASNLYKSVDAGVTWGSITISTEQIDILSLKIIGDEIYVGTYNHGIFSSIDFGGTWIRSTNPLKWVSGIEKFGNNLYASTIGFGVFVYDYSNNPWLPFNNHLPSNLAYNVETIASTSNRLLIGAGGNGTFYHYDFVKNEWVLNYYYGNLSAGLLITKIMSHSDTLFAINGQRIIRSNDGGLNWADDKIGTHNGYSRNITLGASNYYIITNLINGGTWIQERKKNASTGTSWATNEEFIQTGYSFDIIEFHDKVLLAKADGLYVKEMVLGVDESITGENQIKIFPNPSKRKTITVSSPIQIDKIVISNALGQIVHHEMIFKTDSEIQLNVGNGLYLVTFVLSNRQILTKKIIIE